jgi:hypothetical protein
MAAWITVVAADLAGYLNAAQLAAIQAAGKVPGAAALNVAAVITDRANYIRSRIGPRIRVSATVGTVPPELKSQLCQLTIEALTARIPVLKATDDMKTAFKRAYADLDCAQKGEMTISNADDGQFAGQLPNPARLVTSARREFHQHTMRGM